MKTMDDELLVAYADEALDEAQRAEVEAFLETNSDARRFVQDLIRSADLLRKAFNRPMGEPPPQQLLDVLTHEAADVVSLHGRRKPGVSRWIPAALAAGLTLGGVLIGVTLLDEQQSGPGQLQVARGTVAPASALHRALETTASGESTAMGSADAPARVVPMLTFLDARARPCRELEVRHGADAVVDRVIACRETNEHWSVEGVFRSAADTPSGENAYSPAAGASDDSAEVLLDALGAGEPVTPDQERRMLDMGWR